MNGGGGGMNPGMMTVRPGAGMGIGTVAGVGGLGIGTIAPSAVSGSSAVTGMMTVRPTVSTSTEASFAPPPPPTTTATSTTTTSANEPPPPYSTLFNTSNT